MVVVGVAGECHKVPSAIGTSCWDDAESEVSN